MGRLYTRKQQKKFFKSRNAILRTLQDIAYAGAHGRIDHDELIRLGQQANGLVAAHGHLVWTKSINGIGHGLWPAPREGFPKFKQKGDVEYDIELLYDDTPEAMAVKRKIRTGELKTIYDEDGSGKIVRA